MKLYEINAELDALLSQVDPETGELTCDIGQLEALNIERDQKLEGLALAIKNYAAEASAIRDEEKALAERRRAIERQAERAKAFLDLNLKGEKFSTPKVAVSYRRSDVVELTEEFYEWAIRQNRYLRVKEPEADKAALKIALKSGEEIPGAELASRTTLSVR